MTTVEESVRTMEEKYGQAQRAWVMDRGMVSEKNIAFLRARGARYLVGTPKSQLRQFAAALLEKEGWSEVQSGLEAKLVAHPDGKGDEQFILCRSSARGQKEAAMPFDRLRALSLSKRLARQSDALCGELAKIDRGLARKPQSDLEAVGRRIGRWLGRYPAAAKVLSILVRHDAEGRACGLTLSCPLAPGQWTAHAQGAYLLRTNCPERDPAQLWRWYIQLTQAEAALDEGVFGKMPDGTAVHRAFMREDAGAGPVGALPGVRKGRAIFRQRHRKLVREVRVAAAVPGALRKAEMGVPVGVIHALGGVTLERFREPRGKVRAGHLAGDLGLGLFRGVDDQRLVLDERPLDAFLRPIDVDGFAILARSVEERADDAHAEVGVADFDLRALDGEG